jgi:hypothetical protein
LAPVALLSVLYVPTKTKPKRQFLNVLVFLLIFFLTYLIFNPLLWTNPIQAVQAQWTERRQFLQGMKDEFMELAPNQVLDDPMERIGVMAAHLFISEPQFAEVGNYLEATSASEKLYLASPLSTLFRGFFWGVFFLIAMILGTAFWLLDFRKYQWETKRKTVLLSLSSFVLFLALLWAIPLPFQRYYIPLVPFICLWIALGILQTVNRIKQAISASRQPVKNPK